MDREHDERARARELDDHSGLQELLVAPAVVVQVEAARGSEVATAPRLVGARKFDMLARDVVLLDAQVAIGTSADEKWVAIDEDDLPFVDPPQYEAGPARQLLVHDLVGNWPANERIPEVHACTEASSIGERIVGHGIRRRRSISVAPWRHWRAHDLPRRMQRLGRIGKQLHRRL